MTEHVLKIQPKPYRDLESGVKTGEVRNCADRDFKVGDGVRLIMIDETSNPTGNEMYRQITHIQTGYGLPDDICVLSYGKALLHPILQTMRDNGDLINLRATIAHQAQMIEHLRGGLTTPTHIDVANADADGFKNGRKSVGLLLRKGFNTLQTGSGEYKIVMQFSDRDDAWAAYNEVGAITCLAGEE